MSQSQTYTGIILYKRNRSGLTSFTKIQLKAGMLCAPVDSLKDDQNYFDIKWPKFERYNIVFKVILHQFWLKKIFPWKFNLEYGGTFTKLFMHASSRNMFPTTRKLCICLTLVPLSSGIVKFLLRSRFLLTCIRHFFHQLNSVHEW